MRTSFKAAVRAAALVAAAATVAAGQPRPLAPAGEPPIVAGFHVNWDEASYHSLRRNLPRLDWVIPEWLRLEPDRARRAQSPIAAAIDPRVVELVRREKPGARLMPLLQNYHDGDWDGPLVAAILRDAAARAALVAAIADSLEREQFGGVVIDFEELAPAVQPHLLAFLGALRARLAPRGRLVGEAVPFDDDDWRYAAHAAAVDHVFLMAYDEHHSTSRAGPIASQRWFESRLRDRLRVLPPARTIVCIGAYGYDWDEDQREAEDISFAEAVRIARWVQSTIRFDSKSRNPTLDYTDDAGSRHHVWFFDGVTAWNQVRAGRAAGVLGFAIWRLGGEDPSMWRVFEPGARPPDLTTIRFPDGAAGAIGRRAITVERDAITGERYTALP